MLLKYLIFDRIYMINRIFVLVKNYCNCNRFCHRGHGELREKQLQRVICRWHGFSQIKDKDGTTNC